MIVCSNCNTVNEDLLFCQKCGSFLKDIPEALRPSSKIEKKKLITCPSCNKETEDLLFCQNCSHPLKENLIPPAKPVVQKSKKTVICHHCKKETEEVIFCQNCSAPLKGDAEKRKTPEVCIKKSIVICSSCNEITEELLFCEKCGEMIKKVPSFTSSEIEVKSDRKKENDLQSMVEAVTPGGYIKLLPKEFQGPVKIGKPVTIDGNGAAIWSLTGPVLILDSDGIKLKNMTVEVTGDTSSSGAEGASIVVKSGSQEFDNVEVRGSVIGAVGEEGTWIYPSSLVLGNICSNREYNFLIKITVPVDCTITSQISSLHVRPPNLLSGRNEVDLYLEPLPCDTLIYGYLCIQSGKLKRKVMVNGYVTDNASLLSEEKILLWER